MYPWSVSHRPFCYQPVSADCEDTAHGGATRKLKTGGSTPGFDSWVRLLGSTPLTHPPIHPSAHRILSDSRSLTADRRSRKAIPITNDYQASQATTPSVTFCQIIQSF